MFLDPVRFQVNGSVSNWCENLLLKIALISRRANEKGFFPKMRRIRIPGWTSTTPAPRVSRNRNRPSGGGSGGADPNDPSSSGGRKGPEDDVNQAGGIGGGADGDGGSGAKGGGSGGSGGSDGKGDGSGGTGGSGGSGGSGGDGDLSGKQLLDGLRNAGVGSCPYYFFYNTK